MFTNGNNKKQVLLIDDNDKSSGELLETLERQDYHVSTCNTFNDLLYKACASVDIVLLNLFLPDKQGFDICRKIRVTQDTRPVPIIIISHKIGPDDVVEGLYNGADDYVVRPYDNGELIARIEAVIRRSNVYRSAHLISKGEEAIIEELKKIIIERAITPYFQPIYQFKPFKTVGIEVLTRPNTDSMLSNPEILFKAAIEFGFYGELEIMAWKKAINTISEVLDGQSLFLNCDPNFIEGIKCPKVKSLFDDANIDVKNVVLEITERSAVKNFKAFFEHLQIFRDSGFRFAVDDVGGGYASLESIVETKPEIVKIDRHIVNNISKDLYKKSIVKFINSFCKENGIFCVAEGIETKEDLDCIRKIGIDAGQGYFLFKPTSNIDMDEVQAVQAKIN